MIKEQMHGLFALVISSLPLPTHATESPSLQFLGLTLGVSTDTEIFQRFSRDNQRCKINQDINEAGYGKIVTENCLTKPKKGNKITFLFYKHKLKGIFGTFEYLNKKEQKDFYGLMRQKFGPAWSVIRSDTSVLTESAEWRDDLYFVSYSSDIGSPPHYQADISIHIELHNEFFNENKEISDYSWWFEPSPPEDFSILFK